MQPADVPDDRPRQRPEVGGNFIGGHPDPLEQLIVHREREQVHAIGELRGALAKLLRRHEDEIDFSEDPLLGGGDLAGRMRTGSEIVDAVVNRHRGIQLAHDGPRQRRRQKRPHHRVVEVHRPHPSTQRGQQQDAIDPLCDT